MLISGTSLYHLAAVQSQSPVLVSCGLGFRLNDIAHCVHTLELRDVTGHVGSHSVTCHLSQVNMCPS